MSFAEVIGTVGRGIDAVGVAVIAVGALISAAGAVKRLAAERARSPGSCAAGWCAR